jgi:hypothetical protein
MLPNYLKYFHLRANKKCIIIIIIILLYPVQIFILIFFFFFKKYIPNYTINLGIFLCLKCINYHYLLQ